MVFFAQWRQLSVAILGLLSLPGALAGPVFINEIHYDNSGSDSGEGVELAGLAGTSLDGWLLEFYNGGNGQRYKSVSLSGVIDDEAEGLGALWFGVPGIQNGAPDGMALVNPLNESAQFLSYEGRFQAADGAAAGQWSVSIDVFEPASTAVGTSLQLIGLGRGSGDFSWSAGADASYGMLNAGQTISGVSVLPPDPGASQEVVSPGALSLMFSGMTLLWICRRSKPRSVIDAGQTTATKASAAS